jgi:hypothetical protein
MKKPKAYRPRFIPVFPGFTDGPDWLFSPPDDQGWAFYYVKDDGSKVRHREQPMALMDTLTHDIVPAWRFVLREAQA